MPGAWGDVTVLPKFALLAVEVITEELVIASNSVRYFPDVEILVTASLEVPVDAAGEVV